MSKQGISSVLECLLNRGTGSEEDTYYFSDIKHDVLLNTLKDYLNNHRHFLGYCHIEVCQALNDRGVDLILTTNNYKIGFQIKSHFDVTEKDFAAKVKRQFAEALSHDLDLYYILICSAMIIDGNNNYKMRVTHLLNEIGLYKKVDFVVYSPLNTIMIFKHPPTVAREELLKRQAIDESSLHDYEKGYEHLPEVSSDEIDHARQRLESYRDDWFDSEEGMEAFGTLQQLIEDKCTEQFITIFLPTLPSNIRQKRTELIEKATSLLAECRNCKSWDDCSEYKLPSCLDQVPEEMIPYTSLPNLLRITDSLKEYLEVHRKMDKDSE
jgi:hypothetical protein